MNLVVPGLWLGDLPASLNGLALSEAGISHVVDLANTVADKSSKLRGPLYEVKRGEPSCDWIDECPSVVSKLMVVVDDTEEAPIAAYWPKINTFVNMCLHERKGSVLVHCVRGRSRSAATVVQFLMKEQGLNLRLAMRTVHSARPECDINVGFKQLLQHLEAELHPREPPSIVLKLKSKKPDLGHHAKNSRTSRCVTKAKFAAGARALEQKRRGRIKCHF